MSKILQLIRERRKYEYRTLGGGMPTNLRIYNNLTDEIEFEMKTIGGQNKTIMRKEAKNNPFLTSKLKEGEQDRIQKL